MLVLRRKAGEAIVLNGTITIHVLAVEGERVKLGISAPPEVVIVRSELLDGGEQLPAGPVAAAISVPGAPQLALDGAPAFHNGENGAMVAAPPLHPVRDANTSYPGRSSSRHRREPAGARSLPNSARYR
jgi:carbon storage regulator